MTRLPTKRTGSKYNSRKTVVDGITFDSNTEYNRWLELQLMERAGMITDLQRQVSFELQPKFKKNGKTYRPITYVADFVYTQDGKAIVEDRKGFLGIPVFAIKLKLFEYKFNDLTLLITK